MLKKEKYTEQDERTVKVDAMASRLAVELAEMNMVGMLVVSSVHNEKEPIKDFSGVKLLTPVTTNGVVETEKVTEYFYGKPFASLMFMSDRLEAGNTALKSIAMKVMDKVEAEHGTETVKDAQKLAQVLGLKSFIE